MRTGAMVRGVEKRSRMLMVGLICCSVLMWTGCGAAQASAPPIPPATTDTSTESIFIVGQPYATVQAAMDAANAHHGGTVLIPDGTYAGPTTFYPGVYLHAAHPSRPDLCVESLGATGCPSPHATTASVTLTYSSGLKISDVNNMGLVGVTLDFTNSSGGNLTIAGVAQSNFDMTVNQCAITSPCVTFDGSASGNTNKNTFPYLGVAGGSEGIRFQGTSAGHGAFVNQFGFVIIAELAAPSGIYTALDFNGICDTNDFTDVGFYSGQTAANGVIFNSSSATQDADANGITINNFWSTALTFTSGTGVTFNPSAGNYIRTGVLNWANLTPCATGSLSCVAAGGTGNSPNFTWIQADPTPSRVASMSTYRVDQPVRGDFADVSACVGGSKAIVFAQQFNANPVVLVFDETTAGGAKLSAKSNTGFTVSCAGATDTFDWMAIGNPN